jgi:hypothetical protein
MIQPSTQIALILQHFARLLPIREQFVSKTSLLGVLAKAFIV